MSLDIDATIAALQALKAQQASAPASPPPPQGEHILAPSTAPAPVPPQSPPIPPSSAPQGDIAAIVRAEIAAALKGVAVAPVVPSTHPISDRGSPAPNGAVGWRYELS